MAAKKKKAAKATQRSAAKKPRKVTAKASRKKSSAKRAPLPKRAKARAASKTAPKKAAPKKAASQKAAPKKAARKASSKPRVVAKAAPKIKAVSKPKPKPIARAPKAEPMHRRDATGHLDPKYASDLRARMQPHEDDTTAFLGESRSGDDLAEELGEEVVESATSGEYGAEDSLNQSVPEDRGGPFVGSTGGVEFAGEDDESNPKDATREPFPTT